MGAPTSTHIKYGPNTVPLGDDLALLYPPPALDDDSLLKLNSLVKPVHRLPRRRAILYRAGTPCQAIYAVNSGAMKSYRITAAGEQQVAAFHLPGEFLGLSGLARGYHPFSAEALQLTSICVLPFERLSELAHEVPALQRQLLRLLSSAIAREERLWEAMTGHSADRRLAFMLIDLWKRLPSRRTAPDQLRLPMSRAELGSCAGLAAETASRILRRFERSDWISSSGRTIVLRRPEALFRLVGGQARKTAARSSAASDGAHQEPERFPTGKRGRHLS